MKPILTRPSWHNIHVDTLQLIVKLEQLAYTFDGIVALTRGGLVPGLILSHALDTPLYPFQYSSKWGKGDDKNDNDVELPDFGGKVLVVDDICDSGHTLEEVINLFTAAGHETHSATLYTKLNAAVWPSVHIHVLPADSPWIIFPWETA